MATEAPGVSSSQRVHGGSGFTLVEILVALSILSLLVIGLIRAFDVGLGWTGKSHDQTVAINLAGQRLEQLQALVEGSPDGLERARRFAALSAPPWQEARSPLPGELARFERETVIEDAESRFGPGRPGAPAKIVTVRIYRIGNGPRMAELTTVVVEQP